MPTFAELEVFVSEKFFTNKNIKLLDKIKGLSENNPSFQRMLALVGYFRWSGYFKLRRELSQNIKEMRILVGIDIDNIFRNRDVSKDLFNTPETFELAKYEYKNFLKQDIIDGEYCREMEEGVVQLLDDLKNNRLEIRLHSSKNIHAKFYLCIPVEEKYNVDNHGSVIMGSSNISEEGLGIGKDFAKRYELNVILHDFTDVDFCKKEFEELWNEAGTLEFTDLETCKNETYLNDTITPWELYMKVLIEYFHKMIEDNFSLEPPKGVKELSYQKDAVLQGYHILEEHHGLFLADVVGLGKTIVAMMIIKRFFHQNGINSKIIVVCPPALVETWKRERDRFGFTNSQMQVVTNGSLHKVLDKEENYFSKEEVHMVVIDEAHGFRNDESEKYEKLQQLCKAPCSMIGEMKSVKKYVMLLSATPLNNTPADIKNLVCLFQDRNQCTIDGIPDLDNFFAPIIKKYEAIDKTNREELESVTDEISEELREKLIDKITIRRTRNNILNDATYRKDLEKEGIKFPEIADPTGFYYQLDDSLEALFKETLSIITDSNYKDHLSFARFSAIEYLTSDARKQKNLNNVVNLTKNLTGIFKVLFVKRLESSFEAFKKSLQNFLRVTEFSYQAYCNDNFPITDKLKFSNFDDEDLELEDVLGLMKKKAKKEQLDLDRVFCKKIDFNDDYGELLQRDILILKKLIEKWSKVKTDPKLELFKKKLSEELLGKKNEEKKLVIFSESVDTVNYLYDAIKSMGRNDILAISAANRKSQEDNIKANFDANYDGERKNNFNIIITSDVLAEGVNLHRSNIIVNYDSPWNATRLMQRIGRINRIGSSASKVYNYLFYPSKQGDKEINLFGNAFVKIQTFHGVYGEDAKIFTKDEVLKELNIFNKKNSQKDSVDKKLELLREAKKLYNEEFSTYERIKNLPLKSRVLRKNSERSKSSVIFTKSEIKKEFYLIQESDIPQPLDFLDAVDILRAKRTEKSAPFNDPKLKEFVDLHYFHVEQAKNVFVDDLNTARESSNVKKQATAPKELQAKKILRDLKNYMENCKEDIASKAIENLAQSIDLGIYSKLANEIVRFEKEIQKEGYKGDEMIRVVRVKVSELLEKYPNQSSKESKPKEIIKRAPEVILSETFI